MTTVRRYMASDAEGWDACLARLGADRQVSHSRRWEAVLERGMGLEPRYLVAEASGRIEGVFPLALARDLVGRRVLVSLPLVSSGGPVGSLAARRDLLAAAQVEARREGCAHLEVRSAEWGEETEGRPVYSWIDLSEGPSRVWAALSGSVRNHVRKATKRLSLRVMRGTDAVARFADLYQQVMRRLGAPAFDESLLGVVAEVFGPDAWLLTLWDGPRVAAGMFLIREADRAQYYWGGADEQYFGGFVNEQLYWEAIRWCAEEGVVALNLGRSQAGSGNLRFKQKWGTREQAIRTLRWRDNEVEEVELFRSAVLRFGSVVWKRLPAALCRAIGPALVKRLLP